MKLIIFTGDINLVLANWSRLYPGAPNPRLHLQTDKGKSLGPFVDKPASSRRGYGALAAYLMTCQDALIDGKVIADRFNVKSMNLSIALASPSCREAAATYGWSVAKAKEVGQPGRGNWLVNWKRHAEQIAARNAELTASRVSA